MCVLGENINKSIQILTSVLLGAILAFSLFGCAAGGPKPIDPKSCMETVPSNVEGLKILQGPRSRQSIIRDMVPIVCNGRFLFNRMRLKDPSLKGGRVIFGVTVEYTGEVMKVNVLETTLESNVFLDKVSNFIMDSDFVGWARDDMDTVFAYPMVF